MNQTSFPGMVPLQFAQSPDYGKALQGLASTIKPQPQQVTAQAPGAPVPGAAGPTAVGGPAGPMPLQPPTLMDALKNMSPSQIMASLQRASMPPAPGAQPGAPDPTAQPGSALFQQAGMMPSTYGG